MKSIEKKGSSNFYTALILISIFFIMGLIVGFTANAFYEQYQERERLLEVREQLLKNRHNHKKWNH